MSSTARLDSLVRAAAPIDGLAVSRATDPPTVRIDFRPEATAEQRAAAQAAVDAFDWSDEADLAWRKARDRQAALSALLGEGGYLATGLRAAIWDLYTLENDRREAAGLARWSVEEIVARVAAVLASGAADAR